MSATQNDIKRAIDKIKALPHGNLDAYVVVLLEAAQAHLDMLDRLVKQGPGILGPIPEHEPDAPSPQWQIDELRKRVAAQKIIIADMAAKIEEAAGRIKALSDALHGTDHEGENVKRRLDAIEKVLPLHTHQPCPHCRSGEAHRRCITYQEKEFNERLAGLETARAWIDTTGVYGSVKAITARLDKLEARLATAEQEGERRLAAAEDRIQLLFDRIAPARTIKGGWVNVWRAGDKYKLSPQPVSSIETANRDAGIDVSKRIACIHIPDFTEGEGL